MNQMRQLADHHFDGDGEVSNVESHILDSCNFIRNDPLTLLFFPVLDTVPRAASPLPLAAIPQPGRGTCTYLAQHLPENSRYRGLDQPGWWPVAKRTIFGGARAVTVTS